MSNPITFIFLEPLHFDSLSLLCVTKYAVTIRYRPLDTRILWPRLYHSLVLHRSRHSCILDMDSSPSLLADLGLHGGYFIPFHRDGTFRCTIV